MTYCKFNTIHRVCPVLLPFSVLFPTPQATIEAAARKVQVLHIHFSASGIYRFQDALITEENHHLPTEVLSAFGDSFRKTGTMTCCIERLNKQLSIMTEKYHKAEKQIAELQEEKRQAEEQLAEIQSADKSNTSKQNNIFKHIFGQDKK